MLGRRRFIGGLVALPLSGGAMTSCRRPVTRENALEALAKKTLVASAVEVDGASERLATAVEQFQKTPAASALGEARTAWKGAVLSWRKVQGYRNGPFVEVGALFRTTFWPARIAAIDALAAEPPPMDESRLEDLGVDRKGLFSLEYLLFGADKPGPDVPAKMAGDAGAPARAFAKVLADNVEKWAKRARTELGDGARFSSALTRAGQGSIDFLVNQLATSAEAVARRTAQVGELEKNGRLKPVEIEGWPSGVSTELLGAMIVGVENFYVGLGGPGIGDLVSKTAPASDQKIRQTLADAKAALGALGPLEIAVQAAPDALSRAVQATQAFEVACKTDLASALGVTLSFSTGDGD